MRLTRFTATSAMHKAALIVAFSSVVAAPFTGSAQTPVIGVGPVEAKIEKVVPPVAFNVEAFNFVAPITLKSVHSAVSQAILQCDLEIDVESNPLVGSVQSEIPFSAGEFAGTVTVNIAESDLNLGVWGPEHVKWWSCQILFKVGDAQFAPGFAPANSTVDPTIYEPRPGTTSVIGDSGLFAYTPPGETFEPKMIQTKALSFTGQRLPDQLLANAAKLAEAFAPQGIDLIVEKFTAKLQPAVAQSDGRPVWTFSWLIRNLGTQLSTPTELVISCKPKSILPCPPGVAGVYQIGKIWGNSDDPVSLYLPTYKVNASAYLPAPDVQARFEFVATVDPNNYFNEVNENNNTLVSQFDSATQNFDEVVAKAAQALVGGLAAAAQPGVVGSLVPPLEEQPRGANRRSVQPALKIASIMVTGKAAAGQPVNLMVTLRNTSDKPIEANLKSLKIACVAPAGATCTIQKTRTFMGLTLQPGQTRTFKLAVKPSTGGPYKVSIVPHNAPASSGRNVAVAVAQAPTSSRPQPVAPKTRVDPKSRLNQ